MTTFTSEAILDSLMRAALQDTVALGVGPNNEPTMHKVPSPLLAMVQQIQYEIGRNTEFKDRFIAAVMERVDAIADEVAAQIPATVIYQKNVSTSWNQSEFRPTVVEWMQKAIEGALAEALRPAIAAYVSDRFPMIDLDEMKITVNVEVKRS